MEANKRSGIALLVLLLAVSYLAGLSSARTHPALDFLDQGINGERGTAGLTCNVCLCPLHQTSSSGAADAKCSCMDAFYSCPRACRDCVGEYSEYLCLDKISPDQCRHKFASSAAAKGMIKLAKAMNELYK